MISHNTSQTTTQTSILAPFSSYHAVVGLITRDDEVLLITERNREPLKEALKLSWRESRNH